MSARAQIYTKRREQTGKFSGFPERQSMASGSISTLTFQGVISRKQHCFSRI